MHLTLYIQACCVISTIMEIDKRDLSYHNPTYITAGDCYFGSLQAKEKGRKRRGQKESVASWMEIRCYRGVLMEQLVEMQVASARPKTFLITGQIVTVIAGVQEPSSS